MVGRLPSQLEYEEGQDNGTQKLFERLKRDGVCLKSMPKTKVCNDQVHECIFI